MICDGCGASYAEEYKFCPYCGRVRPAPPKPLEVNISVTTEPVRYEYCVIETAYEKAKPKGLLQSLKLVEPIEWVLIIARHQTTGKELRRASYAANHYLYWHGSPQSQQETRQTLENGKTELWQFLEKTGWEFYDSKPGDKVPKYFFRKRLTPEA